MKDYQNHANFANDYFPMLDYNSFESQTIKFRQIFDSIYSTKTAKNW